MSWLGTLLYELGIFGLFAYLLFILAMWRRSAKVVLSILVFSFVLFSAISIAFPLVPMLIATIDYRVQNEAHS